MREYESAELRWIILDPLHCIHESLNGWIEKFTQFIVETHEWNNKLLFCREFGISAQLSWEIKMLHENKLDKVRLLIAQREARIDGTREKSSSGDQVKFQWMQVSVQISSACELWAL